MSEDEALGHDHARNCRNAYNALRRSLGIEERDEEVHGPTTREYVYGATITAYGAGGVRVESWTRLDQFSRFQPSRFGGGSRGE